jgi:hypothetical protein
MVMADHDHQGELLSDIGFMHHPHSELLSDIGYLHQLITDLLDTFSVSAIF